MANFLNMKNNLIQNFYIIGITPDDINLKIKDISSMESNISFEPKIITKFPDINNNYNTIPSEIIIEHCFPTGLKTIKGKKKDLSNNKQHFWFELDNLKYNYLIKNQMLYSKIYFTCLKFNESLHDYEKLKTEISNLDKANNKEESSIKENNSNNLLDDNTIFFPKVICFASLRPFHRELTKILDNLYDYFLFYNKILNKNSNKDVFIINNLAPIEKIIEQIVMCMPFPLSIKNDYCIQYKFNFPINIMNSTEPNMNISKTKSVNLLHSNPKNNNNTFPYNNTTINFQAYDPLNYFMNNIESISLLSIFLYFTEEDILKIFKYIILEIPILFFNENIEILSGMVEGFLSLLHPFEYVQPHISILPSKFYGIINTEYKFIFGINENYSPDFFKNNNILLDKTIIVVHILNQKIKIEEVKKLEDQKDYVIIDNYNIFNLINNESILPNGSKIDINNIDLPIKHKKKLMSKIKSFITESKKKKVNYSGDNEIIFNQKIRYSFYKFFVNLLSGFTDYLQKINKYDINDTNDKSDGYYLGDNIRFKINYINNYNNNNNNISNNETLFIKALFNMDEFISKFSKDNHMFYKLFCNTKLFYNFIRKLIFQVDAQTSLFNKYFNTITFFKQHKEFKKKNKYNDKFLIYEDPFKMKNITKSEVKNFINILSDMNFNSDEINMIILKNKDALIKYNQIINKQDIQKNDNICFIKYIIFPKLFLDNSFFDIPYDELFYRHYLELPTNNEISNLYKQIENLNKEYDEEFEELIYSKNQNEINNSGKNLIDLSRVSTIGPYISSNNNNINTNISTNLEVLVDDYIEYNWLLLISCSLWYCQNQIEIGIRITKIFDVLEKMDFIEEQVLFFLYMSLYKYGDKAHFIKMFEFINRFMGYSSYVNLLFMCLKLSLKEKDNAKEIKDNLKDNINNNDINKNKDNLKLRSFFDSDQIESLMKSKSDNLDELKISKENSGSGIKKEEINFYTNQICPKCKEENEFINIYDLIHHRISKKREKLTYRCSNCGEENLEIKIRYKLFLNRKKKGEQIVITEGIFKLIPPHIIYKEMKEYLLNIDNYKLDIDNIFSNNKIYLLNNIFYFSDKMLPFDFLIPYEGQGNRDYFFEDEDIDEVEEEKELKNEIIEETNEEKNKELKLEPFSINKGINFSLINQKINIK